MTIILPRERSVDIKLRGVIIHPWSNSYGSNAYDDYTPHKYKVITAYLRPKNPRHSNILLKGVADVVTDLRATSLV